MIGAGLTDCGLIREINEDTFSLHISENHYSLAIVADGMGGHLAGEVASSIACDGIREKLLPLLGDPHVDVREHLYHAIERVNAEIYQRSISESATNGMGTTVVVAVADSQNVYYAHVGDSRLYLMQAEQLHMLTQDHSHVQQLVNEGVITLEQARFHSKRNIILRALGTEPDVVIDMGMHHWHPGDRLLLCSDGLSNMLSEQEIRETLASNVTPEEQLGILLRQALEAGGDDNITAIILSNK